MRFLRLESVLIVASLCAFPAVASDQAAEIAAFSKFDREIRGRLVESRGRHRVLQAALASAGYDETMKLIKIEEAKDKDAAKAVEAEPVPADLKAYAADLERAKRQAVGAFDARSERNERLAAARENAYGVFAEGILQRLRSPR